MCVVPKTSAQMQATDLWLPVAKMAYGWIKWRKGKMYKHPAMK